MTLKLPEQPPLVPVILQPRSTDEYRPRPYSLPDLAAVRSLKVSVPDSAHRVNISTADYSSGRFGTATALRTINEQWGYEFYDVPREAMLDTAAADAALGGDQLVIDVQTHYVADRPAITDFTKRVLQSYRALMPEGFKGLDGMVAYSLAEYLRCVFLESETAVAVLTSPPGIHEDRPLTNGEMAGTRELFERFGGNGRLLNHCVVHPNVPSELWRLDRWQEMYRPRGWKVYTPGVLGSSGWVDGSGWMLDDEDSGVPFLERSREVGVNIVCAHKGLSGGSPLGSPRDVGPVAAHFSDIDFLIYHSGYEHPEAAGEAEGPYDPISGHVIDPWGEEGQEGPYSDDVADVGTNRLIKSLEDSKVPSGANVYAELGSTWFSLIRRPREAAHVLGKLLLAVGEENVLWGTDSIWYGPTQPIVDAFRAFQIPEEYRQRYGYPELTPAVKEKILGLNAARVYSIDLEATRSAVKNDDLGWAKAALEEYQAKGVPTVE